MTYSISLAFFGSSPNSLLVLQAIKDAGFQVRLVVTAPPRPVGRKQTITKTPPHTFAEENGITVLSPEKLTPDVVKVLKKHALDVAVVADYAKLILKEALDHPRHGFLNLHPSLLPKYRGSSPAEYTIINGDGESGLTIVQMDEQFDHGPIVAQFTEEIRDSDTSETLYRRLFVKGAEVLTTILPAWVKGRITPREQDHSKATYAPRLTREDGFMHWDIIKKAVRGEEFQTELLKPVLRKVFTTFHVASDGDRIFAANDGQAKSLVSRATKANLPETNLREQKNTDPRHEAFHKISVARAEFIERAIRAFSPWPGIWTVIKVKSQKLKVKSEEKRMKILSAHLENDRLVLDQIQLEGKNPSTWSQVLRLIRDP